MSCISHTWARAGGFGRIRLGLDGLNGEKFSVDSEWERDRWKSMVDIHGYSWILMDIHGY